MFVNWENIDLHSQDRQQGTSPDRNRSCVNTIHEENERKRLAQLKKFESHKDNNAQKRECLATMTKFGESLISNKKEEIAELLAEDCEFFVFNLAEAPAQFAFKHEGFAKIFQDYQITQRDVKYTSVDSEKETGFQFCHYIIKCEKESSSISQFSFEVYSFKAAKISKYRGSFGTMPSLTDALSLFTPSRKEIMLAKVKELNCAFADQPDLEKIALLLPASAEYKIWRWKDKKCSNFNKSNLAAEFRKSLEEDFVIKSIVPFDPSIEAQYVFGSYVFYLEGKGELSGQRYHWISTCIFAFDRDGNLTKISQQGELYDEDDILIPFEVHTEEKTKQMINTIYNIGPDADLSIFTHEDVNFSFDFGIFGEADASLSGVIKGLSDYKRLLEVIVSKERDFEVVKQIDTYLDCDDPCYDTAITTDYMRGIMQKEGHRFNGKLISVYGMRKFSFENGKLAKIIAFFIAFHEPIPSPFDDINFVDLNIRPKMSLF